MMKNRSPQAGVTIITAENMSRMFSGKISTRACVLKEDGEIEDILDVLVGEEFGRDLRNLPHLLPEIMGTTIGHPEIDILGCSLNGIPSKYPRTYYPRMYMAKFGIKQLPAPFAGITGWVISPNIRSANAIADTMLLRGAPR